MRGSHFFSPKIKLVAKITGGDSKISSLSHRLEHKLIMLIIFSISNASAANKRFISLSFIIMSKVLMEDCSDTTLTIYHMICLTGSSTCVFIVFLIKKKKEKPGSSFETPLCH